MVSWMQGTDCGLRFQTTHTYRCKLPKHGFIHCLVVILTAASQPALRLLQTWTIVRARTLRQDRACCFPSRMSSSLS